MLELIEYLTEWASNPATVERIQGGLRELVDEISQGCNLETMTRRRAEIEQLLTRAKERLLLVDDELLPIIQQQVKELLAEQRLLDKDIAFAEKSRSEALRESDNDFATAAAQISRVQEILATGDPHEIRTALADLIERIDVDVEKYQSKGKKFFYRIAGGEIKLRSDLVKLVNRR
jgi:hypothetical protein